MVNKLKIMADDAISLANVLRLLSRSSSFDRRVNNASWSLSTVNGLFSTHLEIRLAGNLHIQQVQSIRTWPKSLKVPLAADTYSFLLYMSPGPRGMPVSPTWHAISSHISDLTRGTRIIITDFGPCIIWKVDDSSQYTSFEIMVPAACTISRIGCRPDFIARVPVNSGRTAAMLRC